MCGGAIISDFIDLKRGRKLTAEDLWSELDTFSDLFGLNSNGKANTKRVGQKFADRTKQPQKGTVLIPGSSLDLQSSSFTSSSFIIAWYFVFLSLLLFILFYFFSLLDFDILEKKFLKC